jgi:hypothetical protein
LQRPSRTKEEKAMIDNRNAKATTCIALLALAGCGKMSYRDQKAAEAQCEKAGGVSIALTHLWGNPSHASYVECIGGSRDGDKIR